MHYIGKDVVVIIGVYRPGQCHAQVDNFDILFFFFFNIIIIIIIIV